MGTISISNISTLEDVAAVFRVALYMAGKIAEAEQNQEGDRIVKITKHGKRYVVADL